MVDSLGPPALRRWALAALAALGQAREELDALNVFPVPDGDTGTNLFLTVEAACAAVPSDGELPELVDAFSHGALLGARGNSGAITAQLLRGWAEVAAGRSELDAAAVKEAFRRADEQAWAAVGDPVEGTVLSVTRAAAQAAAAAPETLAEVTGAALAAAREALARTPDQLEQLRRAGVVDAGGRGFVVLLEVLDDLVRGRLRNRRSRGHWRRPLPVTALGGCTDHAASRPHFEVMYLLEAPAGVLPELRQRLAALGDSVVVVGGGDLWHVHVHAEDAGAAVEAGVEVGRPSRVRIHPFRPGPGQGADVAGLSAAGQGAARVPVGVVACAAGPGLAALFAQAGAVVVDAGPGRRPSTARLLEAIRAARADAVVVLPNDPDTLPVAEVAAADAQAHGVRASVLPTRAQIQGLAAVAVHDPARSVDGNLVRMSAAAGAARDGAVTIAVREAITTAGVCQPGDVLGVVQGDFAVVGREVAEVAIEVLERLLSGGGELVTLVVGEDAGPELVPTLTRHLERRHRELELSVLPGGQPRYPLLIGVE